MRVFTAPRTPQDSQAFATIVLSLNRHGADYEGARFALRCSMGVAVNGPKVFAEVCGGQRAWLEGRSSGKSRSSDPCLQTRLQEKRGRLGGPMISSVAFRFADWTASSDTAEGTALSWRTGHCWSGFWR